MRIEDFPRPRADNRRGIHWSASIYHPRGAELDFWLAELQALQIKWVKVLDDGGGSSLELCQRLLAADIMPIVRLYRTEPNPGTISGREQDTVKRLAAAGVRYFETNNEPHLDLEWQGRQVPDNWLDVVVDNFIVDADIILALGGLPALPAMAAGSGVNPFERIVNRGRADLFEKGAWVALHNYTLNRPLDYPYDPVNQEGEPISQEEYDALGPWAWDGATLEQVKLWREANRKPGAAIEDDPSCFLSFMLVDKMARDTLGFPVPIISTEGGPIIGAGEDRRYPRVTPDLHCRRVVEITEFMQGTAEINGFRCPDNYFAICHWLLANYRLGYMFPDWENQSWYTDSWNKDFNLQGELPVVAALKALPVPTGDTRAAQGAITGKVVRADTQEPLPDLSVRLMRGAVQAGVTQTNTRGEFIFSGLGADVYDIAVDSWGAVRSGLNVEGQGEQAVVIQITGGRSSTLSGTVHNPAGGVAHGVEVLLQRDGQAVARATTGPDGGFRFDSLTLGLYRVSLPGITIDGIALDGWQAKSLKLTTGVAAGYRYGLTAKRLLTPEETNNRRLFYGVVTDALGAPLNGIKVQMAWSGAPAGTNFPVTVTGKDPGKPAGYYEFLHTPGTFRIQVLQGDWPSDAAEGLETANVPGREGQPVTYEVNFRLRAVGGTAQVDGVISGGQAGRKVTLAAVAAVGEAPAQRQAVLAANGGFAFPNMPASAYRLSLDGVGVITQDIVLAPGGLFKVLFGMRSRLSGKVLGASEGQMAVLFAPPAWGWTRQTPLAPDGSFTFENLPPGRYRLEVADRSVPDLALTGENKLTLAPIDLAAGRRSVLRGRVADAGGQPKADRAVTLKRDGVSVATARTGPDGAFRFANLVRGTYSLEVVGLGKVADDVALDGEAERVLDVLWRSEAPRGMLQGRVLNANGTPQPFALVRLLRDDSELMRAETDMKGAFKFTGLSAGTYAIAIGEGAALATNIALTEDATVVRDVMAPAGPIKVITHYLLFGVPPPAGQSGHAEARLLLGLTAHYLDGDVAGGFSIDEARSAQRVTIVGNRVPASAESTLSAAGCQVTRLTGDAYTVAAALSQLFAEG